MRDFIDIINESLSEPFPLEWQYRRPDYWFGTFMVRDEEYYVGARIERDFPHPDDPDRDGDWYEIAFGLTRDGFAGTKVLGTDGMAFRIFATVLKGFEEFLHEVLPELLMLSASKQNLNRLGLYQRMARRFDGDLRALGYVPTEPPVHRYVDTGDFDTMAWRRVVNSGDK